MRPRWTRSDWPISAAGTCWRGSWPTRSGTAGTAASSRPDRPSAPNSDDMIRILSALFLIPVFFSCIWFLPPLWLLVVAEAVLVLAFVEYAGLADALGARVPRAASGAAAMAMCAAVGVGLPLELPLVAALVGLGALIVGSRGPAAG